MSDKKSKKQDRKSGSTYRPGSIKNPDDLLKDFSIALEYFEETTQKFRGPPGNKFIDDFSKKLHFFARDFPKDRIEDYQEDIMELWRRWDAVAKKTGKTGSHLVMPFFTPDAFASTLAAHGKMGVKPDTDWLALWYLYSAKALHFCDAVSLSNMLNAHRGLKLTPDKDWFDLWRTAVRDKFPTFEGLQYSISLNAYAQLELPMDEDWLRDWYRNSSAKLPSFSPASLTVSLIAHAKLGRLPPGKWMEEWYRQGEKKLLDAKYVNNEPSAFNGDNLSSSIFALARLGCKPDQNWLNAWYKAAHSQLSAFSQHDLSNTLWALAALHERGAEGCYAFAKELLERSDALAADTIIQEGRNQIYQACLVFSGGTGTPLRYPRRLEIGKLRAWNTKNLRETGRESFAESQIVETLSQIKQRHARISAEEKSQDKSQSAPRLIDIETQFFHDVMLSVIDIKLTVKTPNAGLQVIYLQVDGPSHYVTDENNTRHLNGSTHLQSQTISRYLRPNEHWRRIDLIDLQQSVQKGQTTEDYVLSHLKLDDLEKAHREKREAPYKKLSDVIHTPPRRMEPIPVDDILAKCAETAEAIWEGEKKTLNRRAARRRHTEERIMTKWDFDTIEMERRDYENLFRSALADLRQLHKTAENDGVHPLEILKLVSYFSTSYFKLKSDDLGHKIAQRQLLPMLYFCMQVAHEDYGIPLARIDIARKTHSYISYDLHHALSSRRRIGDGTIQDPQGLQADASNAISWTSRLSGRPPTIDEIPVPDTVWSELQQLTRMKAALNEAWRACEAETGDPALIKRAQAMTAVLTQIIESRKKSIAEDAHSDRPGENLPGAEEGVSSLYYIKKKVTAMLNQLNTSKAEREAAAYR